MVEFGPWTEKQTDIVAWYPKDWQYSGEFLKQTRNIFSDKFDHMFWMYDDVILTLKNKFKITNKLW